MCVIREWHRLPACDDRQDACPTEAARTRITIFMIMAYKRSDRVGDLIREEISTMLVMEEIKDPRIGFVTITRVAVSDDLRSAKVFFSIIGTEKERDGSLEGLQNASGYIRRALAGRLSLKHIPEITFRYDDSLEYSSHINEILKGLKTGNR